jgi:DNA-binding SARP family transcriptional activator
MLRGDTSGHRSALELETLGAAVLLRRGEGGQRSVIFGPSKPLALIVYLASVPGGSATREFLIDLLWADLEPEPARHAFRQTLWYIKQKAGRPILRTAGDVVSLAEDVSSDRGEFLRFVEAREFDAAVALYTGDFLPDFAAPGGLEFEHWADLERRRLRDTFVRSTEHVVRHHLSVSHHRDAVALARRARDADPLSERAWRFLLEALVSANDQLGAGMEADALQQMLTAEERNEEPATRAMLRAVRQVSAATQPDAARSGLVAEMVGREMEFSTLLAAWEEARAAVARRVLITGAPGIGKTRLIADTVARLRARRSRVVWVRAHPGEREIPYALASQIAAALAELPGAAAVSAASAGSLVALNPSLSATFHAPPDDADGEEALRRRAIAVHEMLVAVADEAPVALVVDDLHWADEASRRALGSIVDRLDHERVLFVGAARSTNGAGAMSAHHMTAIRLVPLDQSGVGALLATIGTQPAPPHGELLSELLWRATGGVPLLVLETLQWLLERSLLLLERGAWMVPDEEALVATLTTGGALRRRVDGIGPCARRLLTVMAVAGAPVDGAFLAAATERRAEDITGVLQDLEARGLAIRQGDAWEPAHDHISEVVCSPLAADEMRALHGAVARAWMESAGPTDRTLRSAGAHFARAGDPPGVARAFAAWIRRLRQHDDRRPVRALAVEFLGDDDPLDVQRLVRALPLQQRIRWSRWRSAATIAFVAVASAATTWQWARQPTTAPDEVFLAVSVDSSGDTTTYRVPIRRNQWTGGELLVVSRDGHAERTALPSALTNYTLGPDAKSWISWQTMPDSGAVDLVQEGMTGGIKRLTWAPGDDADPNLSPDGAQLVFTSGRFDSLSHAHVAIMDLATRRVRQLTRSGGTEGTPRWNPEGDLIAFAHYSFANAPDSVCTIAPDGSGQRCFAVNGSPNVLGWVDNHRLLFTVQPDSLAALDMLDVRDWSRRRILRTSAGAYLLSPDGQWVYCNCREAGTAHARPIMFPADHPELARALVTNVLGTGPIAVVWVRPRSPRYITRLAVPLPPRGLPLGAAYRLTVNATTADGGRSSPLAVELRSLDPAVVRIDSGGAWIPVTSGTAPVVVSDGGWRVDTIEVRVVPARDSVIVRDDWTQGLRSHFVPYGEPAPLVVRDSAGPPSFWNHGDGTFPSGIYSRATFDATNGAGLETTLSLPITRDQWQFEALELRPMLDSASLARWDRVSGYPTFDSWSALGACFTMYPAGEGERSIRQMGLPDGIIDPAPLSPPSLHDGRWFRIRLQLFPDGRCGVAINGRPIGISNTGALPTSKYFATIDGQSVHTRILAGPVEIWTGIKSGVDWLAFDTAHARPAQRRPLNRGAPPLP